MREVFQKRKLSYSAKQVYDLVNDIPAYSDFISLCTKGEIISQTDSVIRAALTLGKGPYTYRFTTENHCIPTSKIILSLVEGPFNHLSGEWNFVELADGCEVSFELKFEFNNFFLETMGGPMVDQMASHMVETFERRAAAVYGVCV